MKKMNIKDITLSAMFIALGLILPLFTGQIPRIGSMMLPMHIPVLLCGLICGWKYGMTVGLLPLSYVPLHLDGQYCFHLLSQWLLNLPLMALLSVIYSVRLNTDAYIL